MAHAWYADGPRDLPIRVAFFSSSPSNPLDSAAIVRAAESASQSEGVGWDIVVDVEGRLPGPATVGRLHIRAEVDAYSGGDTRFEYAVFGPDGEPWGRCGAGSKGNSGDLMAQTLSLSHDLRSAVACVKDQYFLAQREGH